jgi:hypothetical protein
MLGLDSLTGSQRHKSDADQKERWFVHGNVDGRMFKQKESQQSEIIGRSWAWLKNLNSRNASALQ